MIMDFADNLSIKSDDTDFLLSMKCQLNETVEDHYDKRLHGSNQYYLTKSYLDSHTNSISLETSKYRAEQQKVLSASYEHNDNLNYMVNESWQSITSKKYKSHELPDILVPTSPLHKESQYDELKIPSNTKNGKDAHNFNFDELDEKVQEGQKIISKVLAEMNNDGSHRSKCNKSFECPLNNGMQKKLTFSSSPVLSIKSSHSSNNTFTKEERRESNCFASSRSSLSSHSNTECVIDNELKENENLLMEVVMLKDKLVSIEVQKNKEILSSKEQNESKIHSLEQTVNTLRKQKENFMEHVSQLKDSLAKKNAKCMQFQDLMKEKSEQINRLIAKDDKERVNLQNEVRSLQMKKILLDKQVRELEKALNRQLSQIKELDHCFQKEKQNNMESMNAKEEEIISLHNIVKQQNETSMVLGEKMISESQLQFQKVLSTKEIAVENFEISLQQEKERNQRLQEQFKNDIEELLSVINTLKLVNQDLKQENQRLIKNITSPQRADDVEIKKFEEEINKLKGNVTEYERFQKSLIDFSEENTKFSIITGTQPSKSIGVISPGRSERIAYDCCFQSTNGMMTSPISTSTKLIKHLQGRVQQLRRENLIFRETSNYHIANDESSQIEYLQFLLKQATKENLRLQKAHAQLQHNVSNGDNTNESLSNFMPSLSPPTHFKALGPEYSGTTMRKFSFENCFIPWSIGFYDYGPVEYTSAIVMTNPSWADPDIDATKSFDLLKFNQVDDTIDRRSYLGDYIICNGRPINPIGRTGMTGRGLLGKWGPNHAAYPVVTCWYRGLDGEILTNEGKPILQFITIQRKDTGEWAIPGGMADAGEKIPTVLKRKLYEKALNSLDATQKNQKEIVEKLETFFSRGIEVYRGYFDDPRNTDNAWMETIVVNFHDNVGDIMSRIPLHAGDDARSMQCLPIDGQLKLYAGHFDFLRRICELHHAYFPV